MTDRERWQLLRPVRWSVLFFALLVAAISQPVPNDAARTAPDRVHRGKLYEFKIVRPDFVVTGADLARVEVWLWPTGTGITNPALIGVAKRVTNSGKREKWVLRIPPDLLAVKIFATAFDNAGDVVGKKSLPYPDLNALYEAMYGKK